MVTGNTAERAVHRVGSAVRAAGRTRGKDLPPAGRRGRAAVRAAGRTAARRA